jgi:surfactin synthase thioesterase subunit
MSPSSDAGLWIRRFHPARPGATRLLCLPHAGGSASFYFSVSQALAPDTEVLAVQYPGRQDRRTEPCAETIPELADRLLEALGDFMDRPLAIFGHSMGSIVGFELAGLLEQKASMVPLILFASGRRAPSRLYPENVHKRDDPGLIAEIRSLSGTEERVFGNEEMLRMVLPAIRSDYRAVETYRPTRTSSLGCPVSVLVGDADPKTAVSDAAAWREHTTGAFDMKVFPGGHFYLAAQATQVLAYVTDRVAAVSTPCDNRA